MEIDPFSWVPVYFGKVSVLNGRDKKTVPAGTLVADGGAYVAVRARGWWRGGVGTFCAG